LERFWVVRAKSLWQGHHVSFNLLLKRKDHMRLEGFSKQILIDHSTL
jgi:hypothetical protein